MKLAEALIQRRIEQLKQRIMNNAKVREGNDPAEDPNALLAEMERVAAELVVLIQRINRTNAATTLEPDEQTIADAIAERDNLRLRHGVYTAAEEAGVIRQDRYGKSEVHFQSAVDVAEMQQQADDLAQAIRELDTRIQGANWKIDLLE